ncbi:MAG: fibronectin type III domain-containing protein [Pseudomonadales bacterium]
MTLAWQAPTENVDGSPLTDLAGYRVYYGEQSRAYTDTVDVSDNAATSTSLTLVSGSYYFAMTALDSVGNESAYSNEVVKVVN